MSTRLKKKTATTTKALHLQVPYTVRVTFPFRVRRKPLCKSSQLVNSFWAPVIWPRSVDFTPYGVWYDLYEWEHSQYGQVVQHTIDTARYMSGPQSQRDMLQITHLDRLAPTCKALPSNHTAHHARGWQAQLRTGTLTSELIHTRTLFGFLTSSATRLSLVGLSQDWRLTVSHVATQRQEREDHDLCLRRPHYKDE